MQFVVKIINLPELQKALAEYPEISAPIVQNAIVASQAILAANTNATNVPVRTGYLVQNWSWWVGQFQGIWKPLASYAGFVEGGTAPHIIRAVNARVLADAQGHVFGKAVRHPGTRANPFIERIIQAAQPGIDDIFVQALAKITEAITTQTQGA